MPIRDLKTALSSPLFLYHYQPEEPDQRPFALASNLSFFLWASSPDAELLDLAESGELAKPEVLGETIKRMLADPRIERFLDSFPSQWMQLENILAATPDPKLHRYFSLDKQHPASLQMLIEPLLLFDAVFVENRPITELVMPAFSYRSDFLNDWYASDLKPQQADRKKLRRKTSRSRPSAEPPRRKLIPPRPSWRTTPSPSRRSSGKPPTHLILRLVRRDGRPPNSRRSRTTWRFPRGNASARSERAI